MISFLQVKGTIRYILLFLLLLFVGLTNVFAHLSQVQYGLSDDFNDGVFNTNYWTATGSNVYEEDGLLKLQQNVTDDNVGLESVPLAVPSNNKIIIDRKFYLHEALHSWNGCDRYFYGNMMVKINASNENYVGIYYYDDDWENRHGTYLRFSLNGEITETRICDATFDTWLTESVVIDISSELLTYYLNGTLISTFNIPNLSSQQIDNYTIRFNPYGWWTGHQQYMDYVNINSGAIFNGTQVVVGDNGTANNQYLPSFSYYKYSFSQQIYTSEEIGMSGTITSIAFKNTGAEKTRTYNVYMALTDKETFDSNTDWVAMNDDNLVFQGELTFSVNDWTTIDLDTPFAYDGVSKLIISVADVTGSYTGSPHMACLVFDAPGQAIRVYRDNSAYNVANPGVNGTIMNVKNQITLGMVSNGAPICEKPSNLIVSDITGYGASFAWTSEAGNYRFEYKKTSEETWTVVSLTSNTCSLSSLEQDTEYNVRVKAVCGPGWESGYKTTKFTTKEVCPDSKVCIGEGKATSNYFPAYTNNRYSLTQQIYSAEEIGNIGAIYSIDFHSSSAVTRFLDIYMVGTEKNSFDSVSDWIAVTATDKVFSGSVSFSANDWTTIELDNPFIYDGLSNVALIVDNNTDSQGSSSSFYVFEATSQAIRVCGNSVNYDPVLPYGNNGTISNQKNRIRLVFGEPPACIKPLNIAINYTGGLTAEVTWYGEANSYNLDVNGTIISNVTSPYTLTGLQLATDYEVKVQANCGINCLSEWTKSTVFTTDCCMPEEKCELTFELTDSYGDGWNRAYIEILDVLTGRSLGTVTNQNLSKAKETEIYTFAVCDGRDIQFVWHSGSYDDECSFVVKDVNEEVIIAGNSSILPYTYTVNCTPTTCRRPTNLVASRIGPHSVVLNWTVNGEATEWMVAYTTDGETFTEVNVPTNPYTLTGLATETVYSVKVRPICADFDNKWSEMISFTTLEPCPLPSSFSVTPYVFSAEVTWEGFGESYNLEWSEYAPSSNAMWLQYDNGNLKTSVGYGTATYTQWGVMYPAANLQGNSYLHKVSFFESSYYTVGDFITIKIYEGGDTIPETLIGTEDVICNASGTMREVMLSEPVSIDPLQNLWITLSSTTLTYPMSMCAVDEANGRWTYNSSNGSWCDIGTLLSSVATYSFMIRGFIDSAPVSNNWTLVSNAASPYTIHGLQPETDYVVRVKSVCGYEGESGWVIAPFTTNVQPTLYNITVAANPASGGTVSGAGTYSQGETCTLTATPSLGYTFTNWTEEGTAVSNDATYSFTVSGDRTLVANFTSSSTVTPHWTVENGGTYSLTMGLTGVILIDGVEQYSDQLEVGAFCGDECRGSAIATLFPVTQRYIVQLSIDGESGHEFTFKLYDHDLGQELNYSVSNPVSFSNDGYGTLIAPYELNFIPSLFDHTHALVSGWNWYSTYIDQQGIDGLAMLENSLGSNGIRVQSKNNGYVDQFEYGGVSYWYGSLQAITNEQMYMIRTNTACEAVITGHVGPFSQFPITVNSGWNWIGYPGQLSISLSDALSGFAAEPNDQIKSKNDGFSTYVVYGNAALWYGSLNELVPGQGYMYKSNSGQSKTLVYQNSRGEAPVSHVSTESNLFQPSEKDYAYNMTVTAVVEFDGEELRSEDYELAAFAGDECRGSAKLMYVEALDRYMAFLLVSGEAEETIQFVLTDGSSVDRSGDDLTYTIDGTFGTPLEPEVIHFEKLGVEEVAFDKVHVYPNPSEDVFNVEGKDMRKIEVVNAYGQVVYNKETRENNVKIDMSNRANGVYLLRVFTDRGIKTQQIIKK
jgi:hypothetical protein